MVSLLFLSNSVCFFYLQRLFIQSFDLLDHPLYFLWRDGWDDRLNTGGSDYCLVIRSPFLSLNGTLPQCGQAVFYKEDENTWETKDVMSVRNLWACQMIKQEVIFFSNPLPYEYKAGTLHPMFTQTSLWKSYLTENPLSVLSRDGSDSEFVKSTAEGSCRFGERGLPWHVGRERINTCETWKKKNSI